MKIFKIGLFLSFLFVFIACTKSNILVLSKDKDGSYCIAKTPYSDWLGNNPITLVDNNNNSITCSAKHRMIKDAFSCEGKKYNAQLTCFDNVKVDFNYELKSSCTEAYGIAVLDNGSEYEVYIGLSDDAMKDKISEYKSLLK